MMNSMELFTKSNVAGVFRGFTEGGLEFHADLVLPYRNDFQNTPMHGQFLLVQLESSNEAVLGRITSFSSEGKLSSGYGEEFNIRAVRDERPVPEDLREQYLKYCVNIRVLGVLRKQNSKELVFVASHRRLPHVGSPVAFPTDEVLQELAGHHLEGAEIGHFALGEYVYAGGSKRVEVKPWMQIKQPEVAIKFPVSNLVSRRSFIFARAGFGKSNLNKLLFSKLYETTPTVHKAGGRQVPVGTIIFDPDGEYFWPDDKGRPGLCDVPHLAEKLVVFTPRQSQSAFYQSFVAGGIKLDIRRLRPADVIAIALSPERQEQQNVRKLRGLNQNRWEELITLIDSQRNDAPLEDICRLLSLREDQEAEALAARANVTAIVSMLHDRTSQLMDMLLHALAAGKICVVDLSQMRGSQGLILSGLILRKIFDKNQQEFTSANPKTIPTIAVIEEAQAVLGERGGATTEPYVAWVKEGRKYDLGALLVTQQPGSIPVEILSQGDNWFVFHLLSAADLVAVSRANAHFSNDILAALLNEPIPGQGVFWSSVGGKPYPVYLRVASFEDQYKVIDSSYSKAAAKTYAASLLTQFGELLESLRTAVPTSPAGSAGSDTTPKSAAGPQPEVLPGFEAQGEPEPLDVKEAVERKAIAGLRANSEFTNKIRTPDGIAYGRIKFLLLDHIPQTFEDRDEFAFRLVSKALEAILGKPNDGWHQFKRSTDGKTCVRTGPKIADQGT